MNPATTPQVHPMQIRFGLCLAILFSGLQFGLAEDGSSRRAVMPSRHTALFKQYCLDCHDSATKEGMIDLETIPFEISSNIATAERWAKVLNAINSGEMPPKDADPISDDDKKTFLKDLSEQMVIARKILSDSGGVITLRRLNRREYANTIEALLGVRPDISNLPDDQASAGFDTQGASLFMSSDQVEQYLAAARRSLELALLPRKQLKSKTVRVEPEDDYTARYAAAAEEMRDKKRRAAAFFAQKDKPASEFGFLDAYEAKKQGRVEWLPLMESYLSRPETKTGATLIMTIKQGGYTRIKLPMIHEMQEGHYTVRVRVGAYPDARERLHYLEFTTTGGTGITRLGWRKVKASLSDPEIIEFPYVHQPGTKRQVVVHQRSHQDRADKNQTTLDRQKNGLGTPPGLWVDWAELIGPEPDTRRSELLSLTLFEMPTGWSEKKYASEVLGRFAERAFRGKEPDKGYLAKLIKRFDANRAKGLALTEALIDPMSIILASPSFLYMVESSGNESSPLLTGRELAVRLSYFLWSSPPDEELLQLGESGELLKDEILSAQTSRLLSDPRGDAFVRGFAYQWLQMERLGMFQFDGVQFPTFDNATRLNAAEEVYQTFRHILEENLPLQTLLKADFVVVNDLMANFYGISGVEGHNFRRVPVDEKSKRGGLLSTAAVLAMGSDGQRTSPVERGAWVLRKLLNDPPPPAPPNVPMLSRLDGQILAARDLARAHQEQPQCANCHQKIDPIGYGLENFTAVGLWRDNEVIDKRGKFGSRVELGKFAINPGGQLPDGRKFESYSELREAVAERGDDFARGFTESLITYGLGRPFGFTDEDLATEIMKRARSKDHNVSSFVHALIQSPAFRTK